jgi:hypothetical protein
MSAAPAEISAKATVYAGGGIEVSSISHPERSEGSADAGDAGRGPPDYSSTSIRPIRSPSSIPSATTRPPSIRPKIVNSWSSSGLSTRLMNH